MAIQLDELVARLRLDDSGFSLSGVDSKLSSASAKMSTAGRSLTTGLTLPIVGAAVASVKLAGDFDATMRQVGIATDAPTAKLEDLALAMGAKTAFSAGDAAQAMLELAKGGMTAATIQGGALEATMTLAAAGGVELGDAATYMSNSLNAFGLEAKDAKGVAVALAGGANASSASVESLGQGLSQVSATAHAAGLSLDETVAILSALDAQGIKGSDAGTSLKTMLGSLVPTTDKAKNAMADLGLSFYDANGNMDDATTIAAKLQGAFGDMSEAQRLSTLRTIFGTDAFRAANALVETGESGLRRYIKATHDEETANRLAQSSMQGINGALEKAKGSMETAAITAGKALAPIIVKLAGNVEDAANWFAALDEGQRELIVKAALAAAALGPLLIVTGRLITVTSGLVKGTAGTISFLSGLTTKGGTAATSMQKLAGAAKLAAGAGGLVLLFDAMNRAPSAVSTLETAIGGAAAGSVFGPWGTAIGGVVGAIGGMIREDKAFADQIDERSEPVVGNYAATFDTLTGAITGATRAEAAHALEQSGALEIANKYGISSTKLVKAVLGQGNASDQVRGHIAALIDQQQRLFKQDEQKFGTAHANAQYYNQRIVQLENLLAALNKNTTAFSDMSAAQRRELEALRGGTIDVAAFDAAMRKLPPKVRTAFETLGVDSSKADVRALGRQYDLTPKTVTTIMKALGFDVANREADNTKRHLEDVDKVRPDLNPFRQLIIGDLRATKSQAGAEASGIGSAIGSGVSSGINSWLGNVATAAANLVDAAIATARAHAHAHSPSRKMIELGSDMGLGLAIGVDAERSRVQRSLAALVDNSDAKMSQLSFGTTVAGGTSGAVRRSETTADRSGRRPLRIVLDVGGGRSFTGWLSDEFDGRDELVGTSRRMRR